MKVQLDDIRADTTGKEPKNHSPRFDYCRKLLQQGVDPNEPLEVYRGDVLSTTIRSIGEGAKFAIRENERTGPMIIKYQPFKMWKDEPTIASRDAMEAMGSRHPCVFPTWGYPTKGSPSDDHGRPRHRGGSK